MVRASTNEPSEDKKDSTKKKSSSSKKKAVVTGVWPCKINGCNKQFAREADLKRHQRTTKLHSMPGFACPQCDATFTRTDALRRHQKSRHNGIVIEPPDQKDGGEDDVGTSGSPSRSRSATPSLKGKERAPVPHPVQTQAGPSLPGGPSSYYRQHTATTSAYVPPRLPITTDPHYGQIGLPTSATRNAPPNWVYPPTWPDGPPPPHMGPISYHPIPGHPGAYYPPHYRPNGPVVHPSTHPPTEGMQDDPNNPSPPRPDIPRTDSPQTSNDAQAKAPPESSLNLPVIDPSLDADSNSTQQLTEEQVTAITQAAVQAVLRSAAKSEAESCASSTSVKNEEGSSSKVSRQGTAEADEESANREERHVASRLVEEGQSNGLHGYGPTLERPEPMEHMLTEDGEPMLNPAELLTQESLASPPPS